MLSILKDGLRANSGACKSIGNKNSSTVATLQSLSINLPRLAYQSNKDETYFRARLALMLKPALAAMSIRKKGIENLIRKGIIPTIASSKFIQLMTTNIIINLTGIKESVYDILGYDINSGAVEILQKVMKTAVDVAADQGRHFGEDSIGVAMLHDDSAMRFAGLDSDKYGKISLLNQQNTPNYSQGITLDEKDLLFKNNNSYSLIEDCVSLDKLLNGGIVTLDLSNLSSNTEAKTAIESASNLQFFCPVRKLMICDSCGRRSSTQSIEKCEFCASPYLIPML